ncbi:MAG: DUF839 domain-containing protein [Nitrospira sp.]|nr:DUF839 domain-containing protein [Nitrospira sp.]
MMAKLKKQIEKWGFMAAKVSLAAAMLGLPALPVQADDEDAHDYGARVEQRLKNSSLHWFGIRGPLEASAPATTGAYRTATQKAEDQVLIADSLKVEYLSRGIANNADQFAFWPSDENPTHQIWCIEEFNPSVIKNAAGQELFLPGGLVKKWTPGVQRLNLRTGQVDTILRGTAGCDGIRRTPWGTILATEENDFGAAYEIVDPLHVTNQTILDRANGTVVDENGLPSTKIVKRPALGIFAWEGIAILPNGVLYAGDELRPGEPLSGAGNGPDGDGGAIFKFIPANPRTASGPISQLSESPFVAGNLYAMQVACVNNGQQYGQGCEVGNGAWLPVSAPNARTDAHKSGATGYYRPEDLELDPMYKDSIGGVRLCWMDTQNRGAQMYGELVCAVDNAPMTASSSQRTVVVNRLLEGDMDMNQHDNIEFQPLTGNVYVIEDNANGDIFACLPDGTDRDIKSDGCVKILSVKDSSAEPTGFKFTADGRTAYLSIQHSNDANMPLIDDYRTDDLLKITGFKIPSRFER